MSGKNWDYYVREMTKSRLFHLPPAKTHEELIDDLFGKDKETPLYKAMLSIDRLAFIPEEEIETEDFQRKYLTDNILYHKDTNLPIGEGQYMGSPHTIKTIIESAKLRKNHSVLEIGTGSGYTTAILKKLCPKNRVASMEINQKLLGQARKNLQGHTNLELRAYDAFSVLETRRKFDRIIFQVGLPNHPHITPRLRPTVQNALKRNGKIIFTMGSQCYVQENNPTYTGKSFRAQGLIAPLDPNHDLITPYS